MIRMTPHANTRLFSTLTLLLCLVPFGVAQQSTSPARFLGTWTGSSTCVGNRPACKNEVVVYRFRPVANQPRKVNLLADKIIDGKRVPMGTLDFQLNQDGDSLTCEFTRGHTNGIWEYTLSGEAMSGTLVILPDKSLGRRVSVHRVRDDQLPQAPELTDYED
jgi:hypothetical protein